MDKDKEPEPKMISALTANFNQYQQQNIKDFIQFQPNNSQAYRKGSNDDQLQQQRQQYLEHKLSEKKELQRRKRQIFGPSSSQEDDIGGSQSLSDSDRRKSTMEQQKKFLESSKAKKQQLTIAKVQKCQVYFSIKKLKDNWSREQIIFQDQKILITEKPILLKQIHKMKIIQGQVIEDAHKIKLSTIDSIQLFIAANNKPYKEFPLNYYIFAYIIQQKLINMNRKLFKCTPPYIPGIPETLIKNSYNYGKIFKKSQILGKWQERLIVINRQGIFSYKTFNQKHSMYIASQSIKQMWSRFEIQQGLNLLIIKILHSSSTKTQFGLPLSEVLDRRCWLFSFYMLMFPN